MLLASEGVPKPDVLGIQSLLRIKTARPVGAWCSHRANRKTAIQPKAKPTGTIAVDLRVEKPRFFVFSVCQCALNGLTGGSRPKESRYWLSAFASISSHQLHHHP